MRLVVLVAAVVLGGCPTKMRPDFCNESNPCESGTCDLSTNTCVDGEDIDGPSGPADAAPDAGDTPCELAGGRIVFATDRDGDFEIATMNADGSELEILTTNTWKDQLPRFSPNGDRIAWLSSVSGFIEAWVMNSDGSDPHNVSAGPVEIDAPRWSASDDTLVFVSSDNSPVTVNPDGTALDVLEEVTDAFDADWSPDGTRLVVRQSGSAANDDTVAIVDRDGTDLQTIVPSEGRIFGAPRWSPSATQITFSGSDPGGEGGLWIGTPTGAGNYRVGNPVTRPSWSSQGTRVAYRGGIDLFVIASSGVPNPTNLNVTVGSVVGDAEPTWAPDSSRIAFEVDLAGANDIFTVDADGGTAVNITDDPGEDMLGSWAPCH